MSSVLRAFVRQVLSEGMVEQDLAAIVSRHEAIISATIYSPQTLDAILEANPNMDEMSYMDKADLLRGAVRGYIAIKPAQEFGPCWDAWIVSNSYGPGLGEDLYSIAFALSPSGWLISDRETVTPPARKRWNKISAETERPRKALDDLEHADSPFHDEYHTEDDPTDDCQVVPVELLNYAYKAKGGEKELLKRLESRHKIRDPEVRNILDRTGSFEFGRAFSKSYSAETSDLVKENKVVRTAIRRILAESTDESVVDMIANSRWADNLVRLYKPGQHFSNQERRQAAQTFWDDNRDEWMKVLGYGKPEYIQRQGQVGLALELGDDKVLKLQTSSPIKARYRELSTLLPTVFDVGTMDAGGNPIDWIVMEKVQVLSGSSARGALRELLDRIVGAANEPDGYSGPEEAADAIRQGIDFYESGDEEADREEESYRSSKFASDEKILRSAVPNLDPDWLGLLTSAVFKLVSLGLDEDINDSNMGFSKTTGKPVFFDV